jgi:hypothetical protein
MKSRRISDQPPRNSGACLAGRYCVALLRVADGDPRWSGEILVADVDQASATTIEHGGTVTVSLHELPRFRNASSPTPTARGCNSASWWSGRDLNDPHRP